MAGEREEVLNRCVVSLGDFVGNLGNKHSLTYFERLAIVSRLLVGWHNEAAREEYARVDRINRRNREGKGLAGRVKER